FRERSSIVFEYLPPWLMLQSRVLTGISPRENHWLMHNREPRPFDTFPLNHGILVRRFYGRIDCTLAVKTRMQANPTHGQLPYSRLIVLEKCLIRRYTRSRLHQDAVDKHVMYLQDQLPNRRNAFDINQYHRFAIGAMHFRLLGQYTFLVDWVCCDNRTARPPSSLI